MNEAEKRRQELLEQTRRRYRNSNTIPAVHPRYRAAYTSIYGEEENETRDSGAGFRLFLAVLLFGVFVAMDQSGEKISTVDSQWIEEIIAEDMDLDEVFAPYLSESVQ